MGRPVIGHCSDPSDGRLALGEERRQLWEVEFTGVDS